MYPFIFPGDPSSSRPFHFADEQHPQNARIGGTMPEGVDILLRDHAEYFGTFPLYAGESPLYFSVFINCSFGELIASLNQGPQSDNRIVAVLHGPQPRSMSTRYASRLSQHILCIGDVQSDSVKNDSDEQHPRERHKFGGRPYCIQEPTLRGSETLFQQGYRQIVQIDFPITRFDGNITGTWPFGDGIFNLFWKYPFDNEPYYWYVQG